MSVFGGGTLDLKIPGSATQVERTADQVRSVAELLRDSGGRMGRIVMFSLRSWAGDAGDQFRAKNAAAYKDIVAINDVLDAVATACDDFAGELKVAKSDMSRAREIAEDGGVIVLGNTVVAPQPPGPEASDEAIEVHNAKIKAWDKAVGFHDDARKKEDAAHYGLELAFRKVLDISLSEQILTKLGLIAPRNADVAQVAGQRVGLALTSAGAASEWATKVRCGRFSPLNANGSYRDLSSMKFHERALGALKKENWQAKYRYRGKYDSWLKRGSVVGKGSGVLTAATAAYDTWSEDADDPTLSTSERVGRSTVVAGTSAFGAWSGAGTGAAIGTAIFPGVGTVVGGFVGGAIGGIAGSELGGMAKDAIGDFTDATVGKVSDAAGKVGDGASEVGKGLKKVGGKLKFW